MTTSGSKAGPAQGKAHERAHPWQAFQVGLQRAANKTSTTEQEVRKADPTTPTESPAQARRCPVITISVPSGNHHIGTAVSSDHHVPKLLGNATPSAL